jgi:hypothetical protein
MFNTSRVSLQFISSNNLPFGCREIFPFSVVCFPEEVTEKKNENFSSFFFVSPFTPVFSAAKQGCTVPDVCELWGPENLLVATNSEIPVFAK